MTDSSNTPGDADKTPPPGPAGGTPYGGAPSGGAPYGGAPSGGAPYGGATPPQPMRPGDEKLWATLIHIGGIVIGFVAPLIGYFVLRERGPFIREHTRVALNFQLTVLIGYVAGTVLSVIGIGFLITLAVWVASIVFSILAALAANRGQYYRYPLTIEFFRS